MNDMSLRLANLSIGYEHILLGNINLTCRPGEIVGIIGSNASGKTTLLNTISGLLKPISGDIIVNNNIVNDIKTFIRTRKYKIGYLRQSDRTYSSLTVREHLYLAQQSIKGRKAKDANIEKLLEYPVFCKMKEYLDRNASFLSGGYNLLLSNMVVFIQDSNIILLDEPSANLDESNKSLLLEILSILAKKGKIILLIEQNLRTLFMSSNVVYKISNGVPFNLLNKIEEGKKEEITNVFNSQKVLSSKEIRKINSVLWSS